MTKIIRKDKELITDIVEAEIDEQAFNENYKVYSVEVKSPDIRNVSLQLFDLGIALGVVAVKNQSASKIYFMSYANTPVLTEENYNVLKTLKKESLANISKPKQLQLLLNSTYSIKYGVEYGNKNTGYYLEHKKQSNAVICHNLVFFDTRLGIALVNNTKTFKKPIEEDLENEEKTEIKYPTHVLENGFVNFATKKDAVYVDKAFGKTHNIIKQYTLNYREAETSFILEYKMGIRNDEIDKFNDCYKGIAYISKNYKIPDWTTLDFGLSADAAKRKGIELLRISFPTLNIIYSKKEPEHKTLAEKVRKVITEDILSDKKYTYSINNISVSDKPFNENQVATLRIIKAKEEYESEHDLYLDVANDKVQHITSQSLEGASDSEFKAIIFNSLASLYFQTLTNFDFGEFGHLSELNNWTFYTPVWAEKLDNNRKSLTGLKTLEIKDRQLNYYIQNATDIFWLSETPDEVIDRLNSDFEFAFKTPNSKWGIVFDTCFGTSLDIEAIHEEAKILKKEKEAIGNKKLDRGFASVDAIDEFFPSVFNSGYTLKDGRYYYYSNKRGRGINQKNKMTTKPRLHSFCAEGISSEEMELLLKFMNHPLLRGGELSVAPVPVKMLRHHKF